jgi:hypothetical protein
LEFRTLEARRGGGVMIETEAALNANLKTWAEQMPYQDPQTQFATVLSAHEAIDGHHAWSSGDKAAKHAEFQGMAAVALMQRTVAETPGEALQLLMAADFMEQNPEFALVGGDTKRQQFIDEASAGMRRRGEMEH